MPITIPKSILLTPKVPSIAVVGLMLAQFVVLNIGNNPEPVCTLKVERPHDSTSMKELQDLDAIKLNITSECTAPQKFTRVTARIQKLSNDREVTVSNFVARIADPMSKSRRTAEYRNLFALCQFGIHTAYKGFAKGFVILESGKKIKVSGDSGKYEVAECSISAQ
jgi:hypothetical protein